jgi:hypothetical protein
MGGGVSPFEWIFPAVGLSHMAYNAAAQQAAPKAKLVTPDSKLDKQQKLGAANEEQRQRMLAEQERQRTQAADDLAARTETPQEAEEARTRAGAAASRLGAGKRRASQSLTDPGMTLSGSY